MEIENILQYHFKNKEWLSKALAHKSYVHEQKDGEHNEKLEFIGDAVLDLVLAEALFKNFLLDNEGDLSKKRASLVNEAVLSDIANEMQIAKFIRLGRGELQTGGENRPRLLASALEAIIGAIYLDGGFEAAQDFVLRAFDQRLRDEKLLLNYERDFKSRLQEIVQKKYREAPVYEVVDEHGLPHEKVFRVQVKSRGRVLAEGKGRSKKEAEQMAAQIALGLDDL